MSELFACGLGLLIVGAAAIAFGGAVFAPRGGLQFDRGHAADYPQRVSA